MSQLGHYHVLTFSDPFAAGIERGKAIGVIDATPDEVFRVATDFGRYKEFMPRISDAQQLMRNRDGAQVALTADLPWPAGRTWIEADYHFEHTSNDIYRIRFNMVRGNMRQYLGSLYIEPWSKSQTAITYELVAEPSMAAPKSYINKGVRRSAAHFVNALRQHINELHMQGMLHPNLPAVAVAATAVVKPNPATLKASRTR
jgi:ribosome-associated toxin RatA of RatAB toxin-antitoxin module